MATIDREFVFLSYASEDLEQVRKFYKGLTDRKVNVWFDKEDLKNGKWKPQIKKAINRSKAFIICLSKAALKKTGNESPGFQDEELQCAYEIADSQPENIFTIVPVRLEDCGRGDNRISPYQQYDLFQDWEKNLDKLSTSLGGISLSDKKAKDERKEDEKLASNRVGRGVTYYYLGDYQRALSSFESAIDIKPDLLGALYNRWVALKTLGRHEDAHRAFEEASLLNQMKEELAAIKAYKEELKAVEEYRLLENGIKAYKEELKAVEEYRLLENGIKAYKEILEWQKQY